MARESDLQKKCLKYCKENNILCINIHQGGWGNLGCPDLILCIEGKFVAVELKTPKGTGKISKPQEIWRDRILAAGGQHFYIDNFQGFVLAVRGLYDQKIKPTL